MATYNYKILGQTEANASATALYTVPSSKEAIVSTIVVNEHGGGSSTYRIAVREDGDTLADKHYLVKDATIAANDTVTLTLGITLEATDVLEVYASDADVSFNAFGVEITP
tara:strand:- start:125 stop:457 length:333 start_codon:yes stop_codon:yes gene_type:complete